MNTLYLCPSGISILEYLKKEEPEASEKTLINFLTDAKQRQKKDKRVKERQKGQVYTRDK